MDKFKNFKVGDKIIINLTQGTNGVEMTIEGTLEILPTADAPYVGIYGYNQSWSIDVVRNTINWVRLA